MLTMTIPRRFRGPPNSGNGGYVCGLLARNIPGAAQVALRAPPPLDTDLDVVEAAPGQWELRHGATLVATGRATALDPSRVERASFEEAVAAEKRTPVRPHEHLLPTCFVCGPQRAPGDGLRLSAGPLAPGASASPSTFAVPWVPDPTLAAGDGRVAPEFVWAALDCPTGYVFFLDYGTGGFKALPILLGTLSARIDGRPRPGERCVITSWEVAREGRRLTADAAFFGEQGNLLAVARAVWVTVNRDVLLGKV